MTSKSPTPPSPEVRPRATEVRPRATEERQKATEGQAGGKCKYCQDGYTQSGFICEDCWGSGKIQPPGETWENFIKTLKLHNKDLTACFNDALAVEHLRQLIQSKITKAEKEVAKDILNFCHIDQRQIKHETRFLEEYIRQKYL